MPNGDVVLRRAGEEGEPLVNIRFSAEVRDYLPESRLEVARIMIHAGIQAAASMAGGHAELDYVHDLSEGGQVIH